MVQVQGWKRGEKEEMLMRGGQISSRSKGGLRGEERGGLEKEAGVPSQDPGTL